MIRTKSRIFNVSSTNATNGSYKSDVTVQLPDLTFHNTNIQNAYLSVLHAEICNSMYIVRYTNDVFVLDGVSYTITRGNYNVNSFITQILSQLPAGYGMTYSAITSRITMTHTTTDFTVNADSALSNINTIMGLGSSALTSVGLTLTFPYVVNFLPIPRLNFRSSYFKTGNYNSVDNSSDVFLCLQNNAGQNAVINYVNQTVTRYLIEDKNITQFNIRVTDESNQLINFNNVDWFMSFQIDIEYLEEPKNTAPNFSNVLRKAQ
jgi:hypothetical protein